MASRFDEQMRLFEAEVGGAVDHGRFQRPAFMPSAVRANLPHPSEVPPPPSYARPAFIPNQTRSVVAPLTRAPPMLKKEYAAAAQISKLAGGEDDDDVMATLLKYEKEVKTEKKRKNDDPKQGGQPEKVSKPTAPAVKLGTQVTPEEIKKKAKQMVEMVKMVKASQVIQSKRQPIASNYKDKTGKKSKKMIRMAGGQMWEDSSLLNWDSNDFRLFCGDLGNDVTDEVLTRTFSKFSSFQQARVVRDKRSNKTKGYGFVSFKDPADFTRAIKEMDGKYVGSRPIKLRKSNWKDRNIDQVKHKQKQKAVMGFKY